MSPPPPLDSPPDSPPPPPPPSIEQQQLINSQPSCSLGPELGVSPPPPLDSPPDSPPPPPPPSIEQQQLINSQPSCSLEPGPGPPPLIEQQQLINSQPSCSLAPGLGVSRTELGVSTGLEAQPLPIDPGIICKQPSIASVAAPEGAELPRTLAELPPPPPTPTSSLLPDGMLNPKTVCLQKIPTILTPREEPLTPEQPKPNLKPRGTKVKDLLKKFEGAGKKTRRRRK